jgi:putative ABC transport system permease protein
MRFSFGPSEIHNGKRAISDVKYDEYEYLKSSMNDLDQMRISFLWVENP